MALDWSMVVAIVVGLGGLGGWAAFIRARGQNRVDDRAQLTSEQQDFRKSMAEQLSALRTQVGESDRRNDVLERESREQGERIAVLSSRNEYQERELKAQAEQIVMLRTQNAQQAVQIAALTEEKASVIQRLQTTEAKYTFVERENNELRQEITRLHKQLPARMGTA